MQDRLKHLRDILTKASLEAVLISSSSNIFYLTGYQGFSNTEREGFILITMTNAYLLTDARYSEYTRSSIHHFLTVERTNQKSIPDLVHEILTKSTSIKTGFEDTNMTVSECVSFQKKGIKMVPLSLRNLRITKEKEEIKSIKKAATIAFNAFEIIKKQITPGVTEQETVKQFEEEIRKQNAEVAFPTIVAFGKNASIPHHMSNTTTLKKNDLILMDFGARYNGYCSDTTRTFFIGSVPKKWKEIYSVVENAHNLAVNYIQRQLDGKKIISAKDVDAVAREYIQKKDYPSIPHSLGHGTGIDLHESPTLSPKSEDELTEGMVFSIEPGIYLPSEMGIRIEDLYTINSKSIIRL